MVGDRGDPYHSDARKPLPRPCFLKLPECTIDMHIERAVLVHAANHSSRPRSGPTMLSATTIWPKPFRQAVPQKAGEEAETSMSLRLESCYPVSNFAGKIQLSSSDGDHPVKYLGLDHARLVEKPDCEGGQPVDAGHATAPMSLSSERHCSGQRCRL
ncbi:hypothetical protein CP533_3230 [Ophiocordyceps camponoti-saundersi (nom. inval.)]|nr:hypothetical protein CP533_3230 [Ophiocordyceps camponoti-saundersi (nom. inval.)]